MRLDEFSRDTRYTAHVLASERLTPENSEAEIRHLVFRVEKAGFSFEVGQNIGIIVPGPHGYGHRQHFRLYSIANEPGADMQVEICVKRCFSIDEISGERHPGIASNYLCDRVAGDRIEVTGPYGQAFETPDDDEADLLMIGLGTGIAPFRAFVKHLYRSRGGWRGRVRLFYGAKSGLEVPYLNDELDDFAQYYDRGTFKAFAALSPRPHMDDPVELDRTLAGEATEVWDMVGRPETRVFVAGLESAGPQLDRAFAAMAGSDEKWRRRKAELVAGGRWQELLY
jgi:ferredoxin--NADP+ reductase